MKIKREILGQTIEIELTLTEVADAYEEARKSQIRDMLNDQLSLNLYHDIPEETFEKLVDECNEEWYEIDADLGYNIYPAVKAVIEKNKGSLSRYKDEPYKMYEIEGYYHKSITYTVKAKSEEDAERIFGQWKERNIEQLDMDIADIDGELDWNFPEECDGNPDYADIEEDE